MKPVRGSNYPEALPVPRPLILIAGVLGSHRSRKTNGLCFMTFLSRSHLPGIACFNAYVYTHFVCMYCEHWHL